MTITYKNSSSNQDADKNKSLIGKLEITDLSGNSILPETSTGSSSSPITGEQGLYGLKIKDLVDVLYPVESVYISFDSTDPSEIMGGRWERVSEGRTLVGVNESDSSFNTVEKAGGSKTINLAHSHTTKDHTLTIDEIPSHNHTYNVLQVNGTGSAYVTEISETLRSYRPVMSTNYTGGDGAHNHGETTSSLSTSESILSPYITVYMWKRIS